MSDRVGVVVTSINPPNKILAAIADGCAQARWDFYVVGDRKSPADFSLPRCRFFSADAQIASGFAMAAAAPFNHYSRKNVGYLLAIRDGATIIVETDDDNIPVGGFWSPRERSQTAAVIYGVGWVNAYRYFSDELIWPRGLPLDAIHDRGPDYGALPRSVADCPIQQGLADNNPDIDAVFRLIFPGAFSFRSDRRLVLGRGKWCPFNSQNTTWWRDAFALMYLPSFCSFRMTDIWRSFVAERICWENGWSVLFHEATVRQERNFHDLMRDFADEVPGYLNNRKIAEMLEKLPLRRGTEAIPDNLRVSYQVLCDAGLIGSAELLLLEAWFSDLSESRCVVKPLLNMVFESPADRPQDGSQSASAVRGALFDFSAPAYFSEAAPFLKACREAGWECDVMFEWGGGGVEDAKAQCRSLGCTIIGLPEDLVYQINSVSQAQAPRASVDAEREQAPAGANARRRLFKWMSQYCPPLARIAELLWALPRLVRLRRWGEDIVCAAKPDVALFGPFNSHGRAANAIFAAARKFGIPTVCMPSLPLMGEPYQILERFESERRHVIGPQLRADYDLFNRACALIFRSWTRRQGKLALFHRDPAEIIAGRLTGLSFTDGWQKPSPLFDRVFVPGQQSMRCLEIANYPMNE